MKIIYIIILLMVICSTIFIYIYDINIVNGISQVQKQSVGNDNYEYKNKLIIPPVLKEKLDYKKLKGDDG